MPTHDISERLDKWRDAVVAKSTRSAETTVLKAFKKRGASVNSEEAMVQLKSMMDTAEANALNFFDGLNVPMCRMGTAVETSTARGKAMIEALNRAQSAAASKGNDSELKFEFGLAAAMSQKQREGFVKSKKAAAKSKSDKNSSKTCILTLGRHMLKQRIVDCAPRD